MVSRRIVNTSPLILLSKLGLLELLRAGDLPVIAPQAVLDEIGRHGSDDQTLHEVRSTGWLRVVPRPSYPTAPRRQATGLGRARCARFALAQPGSEVVLDDLPARPGPGECGLGAGDD